jgi:transposase-like protein
MKNKGKRYNEEFRTDIIRLVREENRPVSSIAKDFGVNDQTVRNWLKESKDKQDPDKVRISELEAELKEAKKKVADQELTIDILKKATAIFARTTGSNLPDSKEGKLLPLPG